MFQFIAIQMPRRIEQWFKALLAAFISGCANSFLSALGISAANSVGIKVDQLKPGQLLDMTLIGGLVGLFMYLKQSPVPPDSTGETVMLTKADVKNPPPNKP